MDPLAAKFTGLARKDLSSAHQRYGASSAGLPSSINHRGWRIPYLRSTPLAVPRPTVPPSHRPTSSVRLLLPFGSSSSTVAFWFYASASVAGTICSALAPPDPPRQPSPWLIGPPSPPRAPPPPALLLATCTFKARLSINDRCSYVSYTNRGSLSQSCDLWN
ncbi:proline-rich protein 36-like [Sinocyclocheilus grahami]|uniref:proline-rich protein 36-like n=1 Tax=Sinocyclocheilus grahami TaxID=75366 RepID=UPI0007ACC326|nr:PREDICTED: proline-rich protein 36-like [Sinocyclocheilus grahami]